jgi:hypothetical protein
LPISSEQVKSIQHGAAGLNALYEKNLFDHLRSCGQLSGYSLLPGHHIALFVEAKPSAGTRPEAITGSICLSLQATADGSRWYYAPDAKTPLLAGDSPLSRLCRLSLCTLARAGLHEPSDGCLPAGPEAPLLPNSLAAAAGTWGVTWLRGSQVDRSSSNEAWPAPADGYLANLSRHPLLLGRCGTGDVADATHIGCHIVHNGVKTIAVFRRSRSGAKSVMTLEHVGHSIELPLDRQVACLGNLLCVTVNHLAGLGCCFTFDAAPKVCAAYAAAVNSCNTLPWDARLLSAREMELFGACGVQGFPNLDSFPARCPQPQDQPSRHLAGSAHMSLGVFLKTDQRPPAFHPMLLFNREEPNQSGVATTSTALRLDLQHTRIFATPSLDAFLRGVRTKLERRGWQILPITLPRVVDATASAFTLSFRSLDNIHCEHNLAFHISPDKTTFTLLHNRTDGESYGSARPGDPVCAVNAALRELLLRLKRESNPASRICAPAFSEFKDSAKLEAFKRYVDPAHWQEVAATASGPAYMVFRA